MPVIGIGMDIVSVPEFSEQLTRPGSVFAARVFTPAESAYCGSDSSRFAARWAAKEAVLKAWSSSRFGQAPEAPEQLYQEIEVVKDAWGRPAVELHGRVAECLEGVRVHVTLTHDGPMAGAMVVLERD
ncbi:holo-ACP synthase [Smaragdicoccus niigatensis]|uniref:holo-ACP synthase AcpS n=1 Tax=Smaragdicoccus niigatensis TaxID=359359 RepID=UPI00047590D4|nr:holo-ACP synthase [Smaragdicoccus niigatensis]